MKKFFWGIFICLLSIFLLRYLLLGHAVYGDGLYYWMYARTLVIDQNFRLLEEQRHRYSPEGNNTAEVISMHSLTIDEQRTNFHLPIGTSLGYVPFFYVAHGIANVFGMVGFPVLLNGYSHIYQIIVGMGNVLYASIGILCVYGLVQRFYEKKVAQVSVLALLFSTNLLYYTSIDILNSHPFSFFLSSIFFLVYVSTFGKKTWYHWSIGGLLVGLLTATRTQEVVFSLLIIGEIIFVFTKQLREKRVDVFELMIGAGVALIGFIIGILPQLVVWTALTNGVYYLGVENPFNFLNPQILGVLFNGKTGLLWYSPLVVLALYGLYKQSKKNYPLFVFLFIFVLSEIYLVASWNAWDQAASYGMRMLLTCMPVFALGVGYIMQYMTKKIGFRTTAFLGVLLIFWNFVMIGYFHIVVKEATIDQGEVTREKVFRRIDRMIKKIR